jgi:hypothetical protein
MLFIESESFLAVSAVVEIGVQLHRAFLAMIWKSLPGLMHP